MPDTGPSEPHPTAGAAAVGARPVLVAYNLWLSPGAGLALARRVAASVRGPGIRALGLPVGESVQVSCNLVDPWAVGPGAVYDAVARGLEGEGAAVQRAELVGLIPRAVLERQPRHRWKELGLEDSGTIEARRLEAGLDGGRL
jgi:glutamate formiminotransferase